jgi:hypothetical protein
MSAKLMPGKMITAIGRRLAMAPVVLMVVLLGVAWTAASAQEGAPAPAEEPGTAAPAVREGSWVDFFFGTGVDREIRSVTGAGNTFAADGGQVYCLTRVHGLRPPATVTHAWYFEGKTMARVDLTIGSENWRTWSSKSYQPGWTGNWEVKVLDADGMVLGSAGFEVK